MTSIELLNFLFPVRPLPETATGMLCGRRVVGTVPSPRYTLRDNHPPGVKLRVFHPTQHSQTRPPPMDTARSLGGIQRIPAGLSIKHALGVAHFLELRSRREKQLGIIPRVVMASE